MTGTFLRNFIKYPTQIGAIAPSSKYLARSIVRSAQIKHTDVVVELGTGTGVFTEHVEREHSRLFIGIELNEKLSRVTKNRCPSVPIYTGSASDLRSYLAKHNEARCSKIISGLPFASFKHSLQQEILSEVHDALEDNGLFLTFAYTHGTMLPAGKRFNKLLQHNFKVEKTPIIWRNLPPAFIYRCTKF